MDRFDDLPNIKENIENYLKKKHVIQSEKGALLKIDSLNLCEEAINKTIEDLTNSNNNLNDVMNNQGKEISKNLDNLLKKLEADTNNHINMIEKSQLTEEEKKEEYIKCLEELDNISFLSKALENCIEISEENFLKYLEKDPVYKRDILIDFLIKEEDNLKKNNIYEELINNKEYLEKLYNGSNIPYLKNYISQSSLLIPDNKKLYKLIVNENTDIANAKELLISTNDKNEIIQNEIKKISLKNISKENLRYLFSKGMKIIKKKPSPQTSKTVNQAINKNQQSTENRHHKNSDAIALETPKEEAENYCTLDYNYPYITCKNCDCSELNFNETFPEMQTLKLISCELPFLFITIDNFNSFEKITELYIENCDIIDENFKEIYYGFLNNKNLVENLNILSFKNNKISVISVYGYIMEGERKKYKLNKLQFLDLSNNNINHFNINLFDSLPNLQVIDFSNNNIQLKSKLDELNDVKKTRLKIQQQEIARSKTISSMKGESSLQGDTAEPSKNENTQIELLFLMGGNMVLNRERELEKYCKFLIDTIPHIDFNLKTFNLSGVFCRKNVLPFLYKINFTKYRKSLIEIDLSLCNLTNEDIGKFFETFLLKNLKKINLASNKLTDDFFKILIEKKADEIYDKIKEIDLSNNEIYLKGKKEVINFVKSFDSIQKIFIHDTPAEENINNYIKKKIIMLNEEQNSKIITTIFNKEEEEIKNLLESDGKSNDNVFGNQSGAKLYMNNTIDYKFIDAAKKIYPELFDNIYIKNKCNYFN